MTLTAADLALCASCGHAAVLHLTGSVCGAARCYCPVFVPRVSVVPKLVDTFDDLDEPRGDEVSEGSGLGVSDASPRPSDSSLTSPAAITPEGRA